MSRPRQPWFTIHYNGRDITEDLQQWPTEVTYIDKRHGESDEISLKLHNTTGQWLSDWAPKDGDKIEVWYGYIDQLAPAGKFAVDEWSASGDSSGDTIEIKGLAAPKTSALRTKKSKAYENQSLSDIVDKVASEHGLTVEGDIEDIKFERVTQNGERDLEFLKRMADDYGHYFSVKGDKLVFTSRDGLRSREPVATVNRTEMTGNELISYELSTQDHLAAQKAEVSYAHPRRKALVGNKASSTDDLGVVTSSGDIVKLNVRVENSDQAKRVAKSRLDAKNAPKVSGSLTMVGNPVLVAGAVIELKEFGVFDSRYLITSSQHTSSRTGYQTKLSIERATAKNIKDGKNARKRATKRGNAVDDLGVIDGEGSIKGGK